MTSQSFQCCSGLAE